MELQQHQATAGLTGGYGLYRTPYSNPSGSPAESGPPGFPGSRSHLGGYPGFPPMPGQNSYPGYPSLYPGSQSPGREGMKDAFSVGNVIQIVKFYYKLKMSRKILFFIRKSFIII